LLTHNIYLQYMYR